MLESQQQFKFDVDVGQEHLTEIMRELAGANPVTLTKESKTKFSGHVEIELDFDKGTVAYSISDTKSL